MNNKKPTLGEFIIENQASFSYSSGELSSLLNAIRLAAKMVNHDNCIAYGTLYTRNSNVFTKIIQFINKTN